jgi:hypothetical protein
MVRVDPREARRIAEASAFEERSPIARRAVTFRSAPISTAQRSSRIRPAVRAARSAAAARLLNCSGGRYGLSGLQQSGRLPQNRTGSRHGGCSTRPRLRHQAGARKRAGAGHRRPNAPDVRSLAVFAVVNPLAGVCRDRLLCSGRGIGTKFAP